jgi:NADPH2:quinone reductase
MGAVWYDRRGAAAEVLVCGELPTPEAGHGEVRVKLESSGVNPSDISPFWKSGSRRLVSWSMIVL